VTYVDNLGRRRLSAPEGFQPLPPACLCRSIIALAGDGKELESAIFHIRRSLRMSSRLSTFGLRLAPPGGLSAVFPTHPLVESLLGPFDGTPPRGRGVRRLTAPAEPVAHGESDKTAVSGLPFPLRRGQANLLDLHR
jgi:hypothetical protein